MLKLSSCVKILSSNFKSCRYLRIRQLCIMASKHHLWGQQLNLWHHQTHLWGQQWHLWSQQWHLWVKQWHLWGQQWHLWSQQWHLWVKQWHLWVKQWHLWVKQWHLMVNQRHLSKFCHSLRNCPLYVGGLACLSRCQGFKTLTYNGSLSNNLFRITGNDLL